MQLGVVWLLVLCELPFLMFLSATMTEKKIPPLVWFPTHEGLASHMRQLEEIWRLTGPRITGDSQGRQIVIAPSDSHFYPDVMAVRYCEIFKFPPRITCEAHFNRTTLMVKQVSTPCTLAGKSFADWFGWPAQLPSVQLPVSRIDWARVTCLGGFIWDTAKHGGRSDVHMPWSFQPKYPDLLGTLKRASGALPAGSSDYIVAHWRRGNQLTNKCVGLTGEDHSVNCGSPAELIAEIAPSAAPAQARAGALEGVCGNQRGVGRAPAHTRASRL